MAGRLARGILGKNRRYPTRDIGEIFRPKAPGCVRVLGWPVVETALAVIKVAPAKSGLRIFGEGRPVPKGTERSGLGG